MLPLRSFWVLLVIFFGVARGASWRDPFAGEPMLTVYGPTDYKSVDLNWVATVAPDGRLYVGNSTVLRFDGRSWTAIAIPGVSAVRALDADPDGRLWVGGIDELGYLENPSGAAKFVSLRNRLKGSENIGAVWYIFRVGTRVVFVCDQRVLVWDGEAIHVREMPTARRLFAFRYRDGVAISQAGTGLWFTDGENFSPIDLGGAEKDEIGWGVELADHLAFFGSSKTVMRRRGQEVAPVEGELNPLLNHGLTTGATSLPNGYFCVATFRSGVAVVDAEGKLCRVLDRTTGLPSSDVVGVNLTPQNLLCVVGRRFVAFLDPSLDVTAFGARNGLAQATSHFIAFNRDNDGILVTDDALFRLFPDPREAKWVQLHEDQFLDATPLDNGDFVFGGLRRIATWQKERGLAVQRENNDVRALAPVGADRFVASVGYSIKLGNSGLLRRGVAAGGKEIVRTGIGLHYLRRRDLGGDAARWYLCSEYRRPSFAARVCSGCGAARQLFFATLFQGGK